MSVMVENNSYPIKLTKKQKRLRKKKLANQSEEPTDFSGPIQTMLKLFPNIEREDLVKVLSEYNGNIEMATEYILAFQSPESLIQVIDDNSSRKEMSTIKRTVLHSIESVELYELSTRMKEGRQKYNNFTHSDKMRIYYNDKPLDINLRPKGFRFDFYQGGSHHQKSHQQALKEDRTVNRDIKIEQTESMIGKEEITENIQTENSQNILKPSL